MLSSPKTLGLGRRACHLDIDHMLGEHDHQLVHLAMLDAHLCVYQTCLHMAPAVGYGLEFDGKCSGSIRQTCAWFIAMQDFCAGIEVFKSFALP